MENKTESTTKLKSKISIAHSPDSDDAFMFYALTEGLVGDGKFEVANVLKDIQSLNEEAKDLKYDVQAMSFHVYPDIEDDYQVLSCGGSMGYGYGPLIVSKEKIDQKDFVNLKNKRIAIPGKKTTAYLLLRILNDDFEPVFVPFDEVLDEVNNGNCAFGLVIHEGQLSYVQHGLHKVLDLGEWWLSKTNLPVPLGGNVIKRSYDDETKSQINQLIRSSIVYGLENKEKIIPSVAKYARELENENTQVDKFVSMYVNNYTVDYGADGRLAIQKLFELGLEKGLINKIPKLDFVD